MSVLLTTASMLAAANVFMTIAWYAHLKSLNTKPWYVAALVSWGIALFEYLIQVPANRIGHTQFTVPQLKRFSKRSLPWPCSCPFRSCICASRPNSTTSGRVSVFAVPPTSCFGG